MTEPIQPPSGAGGPVGVTPNSNDAWGQLRWALNKTLPRSLARAQQLNQATRRKLARRRG